MKSAFLIALGFLVIASNLPNRCAAQRPRPTEEVDVKCGANCLYILLRTLGKSPDRFAKLEAKLGPPSKRGYSLLQLRDAARAYGCNAECAKLTFESLANLSDGVEVIVHTLPGHFEMLIGTTSTEAFLLGTNPGSSRAKTINEFQKTWSGNVLLLSTKPIEIPVPKMNYGPVLWTALGLILCGAMSIFIFKWRT